MPRFVIAVIAALTLLGPSGVSAQQTGQTCAVIASDAERLACYDGVFRIPDDGAEESTETDAVLILSEQQIPARPVGRGNAEFSIACTDGRLDVRFAFAGQLLSNIGDVAAITMQVDLGGNVVRNLPVDDANTSVGFASARDAEAFLDSLVGARGLRVRVTPVRQRSLLVDFRVDAHAEDIAAVRAACS